LNYGIINGYYVESPYSHIKAEEKEESMVMEDFTNLKDAVYKGQIGVVPDLVRKYIENGTPIKSILDDGLIASMAVIGEKFKNNDIFIPEVLISAKAMHAGMSVLEPHLVKSKIEPLGKVIIGTVKGDLHDIGKNIVAMMLKGAGFEVEDLGIDVLAQEFADSAKAHGAHIIAMSSLITTSMSAMEDTIRLLSSLSLRGAVKVMVGGAPVTQEFSDKIGADAYAGDAASAVDRAKQLLQKR